MTIRATIQNHLLHSLTQALIGGTTIFGFTFAFLLMAVPVRAVDISDSPMGTNVTFAAPNIMFVVDDSGSIV